MSWDSEEYCTEETTTIFDAVELESSEDPPMDDWSSLAIEIPEVNQKKILYGQGVYKPGSGEVCAKYIVASQSSILQHLYYNYPAVTDPGIQDALLLPEKPITYAANGQDLYIATCKEMGQAPVKLFHSGLLNEEINLSYYCVDPKGVRAMAMALMDNNIVTVLNLTDSFLSDDACYHLGDMLAYNVSLEVLNLSGCKIKASGVKRLSDGLVRNRTLKILNLNKNDLKDAGAVHIADSITRGLEVQELYLSYNNIEAHGTTALAGSFDASSTFKKLDFSWNSFISPGPTFSLLAKLSENETILEIDLSWCALTGSRIGTAIKLLMKAPNLRYLNLSNNRLTGEAVTNLIANINKAHNLITLNLSFNPLTPPDALNILLRMKSSSVRLQNLLLENIFVNNEFLELLKEIKRTKLRRTFQVTYGGVVSSFKGVGTDMREIVLKRADYLSKKSKKVKKCPIDIALIVLQLIKDDVLVVTAKDFTTLVRASGAPLDTDLINAIADAFGAPSPPKNKKINVEMMADYVRRLWPNRSLPPSPPPKPEPVPILKVRLNRNKKDKGKPKK